MGVKDKLGKAALDFIFDVKSAPKGYLHHTEINPNPYVGKRFEVKDLGGIAPKEIVPIESLKDKMVGIIPYDLTSRNKQILSVSGKPLTGTHVTHGGQDYVLDTEHMAQNIGGASSKDISNKIQKRGDIASQEGEKLGGTGEVAFLPSTMGDFSERFSIPDYKIWKDLYTQAEHSPQTIQAHSDALRGIKVTNPKTGVTRYPFADIPNIDHPDFDTIAYLNGDLRKAFSKQQSSKGNQKILGVNAEDVSNAQLDPSLIGQQRGMVGNTIINMHPGAEIFPSTNETYSHNFKGNYAGTLENQTPVAVMLNDPYNKIFAEMQTKYPSKTWQQLHDFTMGALEKRNEGISQLINDQAINRIGQYHEGIKQGAFDPNDLQAGLDYLNTPGRFAEGGHATPAWQREEGKNPEGGLNAKGRASYNHETGGHLKAPQPEGGPRRDSFCARMEGMKKKNTSAKTANDPDSRINKSLRKWKC
jgi:hypothetical protein